MKHCTRILAAASAVAMTVLAAGTAGAQSSQQAAAAYESGNYEMALQGFRSLAYQGNAEAQYNLGVIYANGRGVPQDYVVAHMWFNLAASRGDQEAAEMRDSIEKSMSAVQVAEAQKMAREWKPQQRPPQQQRSTRR